MTADPDLVGAKIAFERWRRDRGGQAHPPEVLKEIAVSLSKKYPFRQLARELAVSVG